MSAKVDAIKNLEMAGLFDKDSDYRGMIGEAVKRLLDFHFSEGHSGFSHELTLQIFNKVARGQALTAAYWDLKLEQMQAFAKENMGEPWKPELIKEILGDRPSL